MNLVEGRSKDDSEGYQDSASDSADGPPILFNRGLGLACNSGVTQLAILIDPRRISGALRNSPRQSPSGVRPAFGKNKTSNEQGRMRSAPIPGPLHVIILTSSLKRSFGRPAKSPHRLFIVTYEEIDFCWTKVSGVDLNEDFAVRFPDTDFIGAASAEFQFHIQMLECVVNELTDGMCFIGCANVVIGLVLLKHPPHGVGIFRRVAPIPP